MKKILVFSALLLFGIQASAQNIVTDSLDFAKAYADGVTDILDGQLSNVNVCGTTGGTGSFKNVFIRGLNTIHGDSQPAIFLDGTLLNYSLGQNLDAFYDKPGEIYTAPVGTLGFLSMYDIENIEVIKDISATSQYGTLGANGVILITTKRSYDGKSIDWHSNAITDFKSFSQNHNFGVGYANKGISLDFSGFFRSNAAGTRDRRNNTGGLGVRLAAKSSPNIWFTFNSFTSFGKLSDYLVDFDDCSKDFRSVNNADLVLNFAKMFRLDFKLGFDVESNNRSIWYGTGTEFGQENNGAASVLESTLFGYNGQVNFNFKRYFANKHLLTADLFFEADGNVNKFNAMCGYNFFVEDLRAKGLSIMGSDPKLHKQQRSYGEISGGVRASYSYNDIIGVHAALTVGYTPRYDDAAVYYPVANAWADLHRAFFPSSRAVSALRLTGGYGIAGREYYIPYELTGRYCTGSYPVVQRGSEPFFDSLNRLRTQEWNVGIEAGFIGNRITAKFKYYDKTTSDNFSMFCFGSYSTEAKLWAYTDKKTAYSNADDIRNRGFELDINAVLIQKGSFKWTLSLLGAYNLNQIVKSDGDNVYGRVVTTGSYINANVLGYASNSLIGFREDEQGNYIDLFKDGVIDDLDKQILGSTMPSFSGSINTVFEYRGFALEIMTKGVTGVSIANLDRMVKDGKTSLSESYVEDGSYFRLGRIALSYDIPLKNNKVVKGLGVSLTGINPFTVTKYSGINPDVNGFGDSVLTMGADSGSLGVYRGMLVGFKIKF